MTRSEIFLASKEQALEIYELDEEGELPADIVRVSGLSVVRSKFEGFSVDRKLKERNLKKIDFNEIALALAQNWLSIDEVSDDVLERLERKRGRYQNNKQKESKSTKWSDWGMENLDEKNSEKTPLS